ncbi:hypothetical protein BY458DRAFT_120518 [Sporodiniella umbellata]|nr:hypothetical protein BY458DRAFT_120518 [Sporodiniella umbellata]
MEEEYESVLLIIRECFVYKIPPRTAARGYRAAEWGDLANSFLWKGRLRVISKGKRCEIRLEDTSTGELFAVCPYDLQSSSVEAVLDSSRYFVLKIENEGRHAFIGMGFQERSDAFDFNVTLQDFIKSTYRQVRAEKEAVKKAADPTPKKDYGLKEGQTINITIGNLGTKRTRPAPTNSSTDGFVPLLPPPPSASQVKQQQQKQQGSFF